MPKFGSFQSQGRFSNLIFEHHARILFLHHFLETRTVEPLVCQSGDLIYFLFTAWILLKIWPFIHNKLCVRNLLKLSHKVQHAVFQRTTISFGHLLQIYILILWVNLVPCFPFSVRAKLIFLLLCLFLEISARLLHAQNPLRYRIPSALWVSSFHIKSVTIPSDLINCFLHIR